MRVLLGEAVILKILQRGARDSPSGDLSPHEVRGSQEGYWRQKLKNTVLMETIAGWRKAVKSQTAKRVKQGKS